MWVIHLSLICRHAHKSHVLIVALWGVMVLSAAPKASSLLPSSHHLSLSLSFSLCLSIPSAQMKTVPYRGCQHLIGWDTTGVDGSRSERERERESSEERSSRRCNYSATASRQSAEPRDARGARTCTVIFCLADSCSSYRWRVPRTYRITSPSLLQEWAPWLKGADKQQLGWLIWSSLDLSVTWIWSLLADWAAAGDSYSLFFDLSRLLTPERLYLSEWAILVFPLYCREERRCMVKGGCKCASLWAALDSYPQSLFLHPLRAPGSHLSCLWDGLTSSQLLAVPHLGQDASDEGPPGPSEHLSGHHRYAFWWHP